MLDKKVINSFRENILKLQNIVHEAGCKTVDELLSLREQEKNMELPIKYIQGRAK